MSYASAGMHAYPGRDLQQRHSRAGRGGLLPKPGSGSGILSRASSVNGRRSVCPAEPSDIEPSTVVEQGEEHRQRQAERACGSVVDNQIGLLVRVLGPSQSALIFLGVGFVSG